MAGRIAQTFIDDLLDRLDIVDVIDRRVKLKKSGKNYSARCPFHDEKTPSFSVNPDKQFFYCFGCGAGGNAVGFVMDYENIDFPQAVENLASHAGLQVVREQQSSNEVARQEKRSGLYPILEQAANYYMSQLRRHPQAERAKDYLKGRGLTGQVAQNYKVGYAPPGWDNLLSALAGDSKSADFEAQVSLLMQAGLIIENEQGRRYDRFRDRIMFPIRDQRGRVIAFGGRVMGDDKPKYLNSPETDVFHKGRELYGLFEARKAERQLRKVLVVEGYMDVIALAQHDINYATATLGTATSEQHLERIFRMCPEVVFCFDGDEAGRKAAFRALECALPTLTDGREARFLFLPDGEDPDTLVRSEGTNKFLELMGQATPLEDFLFNSLAVELDLQSSAGRARLSKAALPLIELIPKGVYKQLVYQALAERTGMAVADLLKLVETIPTYQPPPVPVPETSNLPEMQPIKREPLPADSRQRPTAFNNMAESAIALLLHYPHVARALPVDTSLHGIDDDGVEFLRNILELLRKRPDSNTATLMGYWHGTPQGELLNRLAGQENLIPKEGVEEQFTDVVAHLGQLPDRENIASLVDKMKDANYADLSENDKLQLQRHFQQKKRQEPNKSQ
ncbi:MAG: DNA primase [Halieaceae bacterium]|jgi:DNA primase